MGSARSIKLDVVLQARDFVEGIWFHSRYTRSARMGKLVAAPFLLVAMYLAVRGSWLAMALVAALAVLEWFSPPIPSMLKSYTAYLRSPEKGKTRSVEFSSTGIRIRTERVDNVMAWSRFERVIEGPRSFLIYFSAKHFLVIPKRALASDGDIEALRGLLASKVKQKGRPR